MAAEELGVTRLAQRAESKAEAALANATGKGDHPPKNDAVAAMLLTEATAWATLAQSYRTAELTAALGDNLGDNSHLDRIGREVRDGLDAIRVDGVGVG